MRTITSSTGKAETVTVRRTESSDAQQICKLINPSTVAVFGRVNVIYLLEKANLAVTLNTAKNQILAHAAFLDHPIGDPEQASWEEFLQAHFGGPRFTPLNTLFLHLFVAQSSFSTESAKEIIRTVFSAIAELEHICLVTPYSSRLEPALMDIFEPMPSVQEEVQCAAFVCHRHNYCPRLHVRGARVEDHDDLTVLLAEQTKALSASYGPYFLAELIEAQDKTNHVAVCESEGAAVGFMSVSGDVNTELLNQCFELGLFNGLLKEDHVDQTVDAGQTQKDKPTDEDTETDPPNHQKQSESNEVPRPEADGAEEGSECSAESSGACRDTPEVKPIRACTNDSAGSSVGSEPARPPNAFCIQLFAINKRFEMRSVDFLPYVFRLFPERDFCIISVPKLAPEFPLLQTFLRAVPRHSSSLPQELYLFHRSGLLRTLLVRVPVCDDVAAIQRLVQNLNLHEALMEDLDTFFKARRDPVRQQCHDGTPVQAFVAEAEGQVIGILIIRDEQDIEYIRANYSIENFVYFSHHQREEHGRLCHFTLNPIFQHYAKHFLKEALRLAHKSCLYYPVYPTDSSQRNASAHSLTAVLNCMVPVRPRRQILYPLEELDTNAPSTLITREQVPYALNHINRKLTMEPKAGINARIVVVGASDTGLAFLESLAFCPHLRFNNLTLVSTHGLPGYHDGDDPSFLTTSHCYSQRDHALLSLRSWVNVVTGKMTAIERASKHVQVGGGRIVPYDHLILCTGQQYQIPCPTGIDISKWSSMDQAPDQPRRRRYTGHVPSNFFTLNDQHDCTQAHRWLLDNFIEQAGNAVVYGDSADVYSCVEMLLCLGVRGSRIHVVHTPANKPLSRFQNPAVDQAVRNVLENKGVHVHHNCLLAQLNDGQHPEPLTAVSFTTGGPPLRLECACWSSCSPSSVPTVCCSHDAAHRTLPTGRCPQDAAHRTLPRGHCPKDTAQRTLPTGCHPQDTAQRMLPRGCCPEDAAQRMLPRGCCPEDAAQRMLPRGCCSHDAAHRMLPKGHCPQDAAQRMLPKGHCSQDAAHRTLPTECCPQDAAHRTLPTGRRPQDAAHRTPPTGRRPEDAAQRTLPRGRCPHDAAHMMLPRGRCSQDAAQRTLPRGRCPEDAARWWTILNPAVTQLFKTLLCLIHSDDSMQNPIPCPEANGIFDCVFFNFSCKGVDFDAFKAINDACLVFDGRLVIDTTFHTNDCAIRAAGPLTKFARRYHADQWTHADFNSKEVGQELASVMLPFFDPTLEAPVKPAPDTARLIPAYTQPKTEGAKLPGGYSYLHIRKPSPYTGTAPSGAKPGREMVTGHVETGNYFHLQFHPQGLVEGITCLSLKPLPVSNYICLYGKHQLLLNHLYERFDEDLVHDFYSYFRERWCMAIFHDRFTDFEQEVRQIMESTKVQLGQDSVSIPKLAEMIVDGTWEVPDEPTLYLNQVFEQSDGPEALKRSVLDFLNGVVPDCHGVTQNGSGSSSVTSPVLVLVETPNESVCGGTVVSTKMNGLLSLITHPEGLVSLHLHFYRTISRDCVRMFQLHGMGYHSTFSMTDKRVGYAVWFFILSCWTDSYSAPVTHYRLFRCKVVLQDRTGLGLAGEERKSTEVSSSFNPTQQKQQTQQQQHQQHQQPVRTQTKCLSACKNIAEMPRGFLVKRNKKATPVSYRIRTDDENEAPGACSPGRTAAPASASASASASAPLLSASSSLTMRGDCKPVQFGD
ncbi:hypothetical protein NFI96_016449, partial [Prochilodus magdalenae]